MRTLDWQICHVDRHGQFNLEQLRLSAVSEMQTNIYTSPSILIIQEQNLDNAFLISIFIV